MVECIQQLQSQFLWKLANAKKLQFFYFASFFARIEQKMNVYCIKINDRFAAKVIQVKRILSIFPLFFGLY